MKEVKWLNLSNGSFAHTFVFDVEKNFDTLAARESVKNHWQQSFYWSLGYIIIMYGLQKYMKHVPPLNLDRLLIVWNVLLAIFNIIGAWRTIPELAVFVYEHGFRESLCSLEIAVQSTLGLFWVWIFGWSKVWELGDTLFIVLRKRPLTFLHLIHHSLTLILTWFFCAQSFIVGSWLTAMNFFVHSLMYSYYTLKALKFKIPVFVAMVITILQMTQLFCGFFLPFYALAVLLSGEKCSATYASCLLCIFMYGIYFVLFSNYFFKTYIARVKTHVDRHVCRPSNKTD